MALWVLVLTLAMLYFELVNIVEYVTRFTEEVFKILIGCVFLANSIEKLIEVRKRIQYVPFVQFLIILVFPEFRRESNVYSRFLL